MSVADHVVWQVGARLVRRWLRQPLLSRVDLEQRYDLVDAFVTGYEVRSACFNRSHPICRDLP